MAAGRFDGDALDDLVVFDDADATTVYLGNAEGDLDGDASLFSEVPRERRLLAGALGGGANDEILGLPGPGAVDTSSLLELWSDAGGDPQLSTITGPIDRAAIGDLDGDGADDLVMAQLSSILYVRGGSSGENATLSCLASYYSSVPNVLDAMAVGDLDGNGRADVAYASLGAVTILLTE
jgi:hypothetical protein